MRNVPMVQLDIFSLYYIVSLSFVTRFVVIISSRSISIYDRTGNYFHKNNRAFSASAKLIIKTVF